MTSLDSCSITRSAKVTLKHTWIIEQALLHLECENKKLQSVTFPLYTTDPTSFTLSIAFNGKNIAVGLRVDGYSTIVKAAFSISIKTKNGEKSTERRCEVYEFLSRFPSYSFDPYISRTNLLTQKDDLLPKGKLTILCSVDVYGDHEVIQSDDISTRYLIPECDLSSSFKTLLIKGTNADVTLVVKERELKAHKAILMTRSPVFEEMLRKLTYDQTALVNISDLDYDVVKEMLHFIYTGKSPNMFKMADRLLVAANKYDLPILKAICEKEIGSNLSVETVTQMLTLANEHSADQLKRHALIYIQEHIQRVMKTDGWQEVEANHSCILDICHALAMPDL